VSETGDRVQLRETTGRTSEYEATQYCLKRIVEIQKKAHQQATGELPQLTIDEAFGLFYQRHAQYYARPDETLRKLSAIKQNLNIEYLIDLNSITLSQYIENRRKSVTNSTINRELVILSSLLTKCRLWGFDTSNIQPCKFKLKEPAENIKYLENWETAEKIITNAPKHLKPIIYTALYTGLRRGNILGLKWDNLDFENNLINVRVKDRTKDGGKNLSIPMIDKLKTILQAQPKVCEYVFTYNNHQISDIKHAWHTTLKKAGLPYTNFHTLRHTAATWILKKTGNLKLTQQILGHSSIQTTLKYAHVLDEEKRQALEDVFK
jgi:integrase